MELVCQALERPLAETFAYNLAFLHTPLVISRYPATRHEPVSLLGAPAFASLPGRQLLQGRRRENTDVGIPYRYHVPHRLARFQGRQLVLVSPSPRQSCSVTAPDVFARPA